MLFLRRRYSGAVVGSRSSSGNFVSLIASFLVARDPIQAPLKSSRARASSSSIIGQCIKIIRCEICRILFAYTGRGSPVEETPSPQVTRTGIVKKLTCRLSSLSKVEDMILVLENFGKFIGNLSSFDVDEFQMTTECHFESRFRINY